MSRQLLIISVASTLVIAAGAAAQDSGCIYDRYTGATVQIEYQYDTSNNGVVERGVEKGTGFIISPDGHLITNAHVVRPRDTTTNITSESYKVRARTLLASQVTATLVSSDSNLDLALLKLPPKQDGTPWPTVPISSKNRLAVGSNMTGLAFSPGDAALIPGGKKTANTTIVDGQIKPWWQTNLGLNSGNSGGPIFSEDGTVVGVAVALSTNAQVVSYVIPISLGQHLLDVAGTQTIATSECAAPTVTTVSAATTQRDIRLQPLPDTVGIAPGNYFPVTYEFTVDAGSDVRLETEDAQFTTRSGSSLEQPSVGGRILGGSFVIKGGNVGLYHNNIYLPPHIADAASQQGEGVVYLKQVFSLRDASNTVTRVPAVLTIAIQRPASN